MRTKTRRRHSSRKQKPNLLQKGGAAIEALMTQFVAGAARIAPVAFALGYKMYKGTRRVKNRRK